MDKINRVIINGKEYVITADDRQLVTELGALGDGSKPIIFTGVMDKEDADTPITYEYLSGLLQKDSYNNKVFAATTLPIEVRVKWDKGDGLKTPFILVPYNHPNLYMMSIPSQQFTGWDDDAIEVDINFPSGSQKYKLFRFCNWLVWCNNEITWKF